MPRGAGCGEGLGGGRKRSRVGAGVGEEGGARRVCACCGEMAVLRDQPTERGHSSSIMPLLPDGTQDNSMAIEVKLGSIFVRRNKPSITDLQHMRPQASASCSYSKRETRGNKKKKKKHPHT